MSRYTDEADQTLLARLNSSFERAARPHDNIPLIRRYQVVKLKQVHMIRLEPVQRPMEPLPGLLVRALAGLGRQEELIAVPLHPRADAQLRLAIAEGGVDVVDAVTQQQIERAIGIILGGVSHRVRAEDDTAAKVAGAAEGRLGDH